MVVSKHNSLRHYQWGNNCDGWNFVDEKNLGVKQEKMPANTQEQLHYHQHAQQFFFILKGVATFEIDGVAITVNENEGIHIQPMAKHKIMNNSNAEMEFILTSQPSTANDRYNL